MQIEKLPGYRVIKFTHELDKPQIWGFIEFMKKAIPPNRREYDPKRKTWTIEEGALPDFDAIYDEFFSDENQEELF